MFRIKSLILITSFLNILQKDTTMLMRLLFITHSLAHTIWSSSSGSLSVIVNFVKTKSIKTSFKMWIFLVQDMKVSVLRRSDKYSETTSKMKTVTYELTFLQNVCLMKIYKWKMFDNSYDYLTLYFKCYYRT